jgi:hypothetical protein
VARILTNIVNAVLRCQQKQTRAQQIKSHYSTTRYESVCCPAQDSHSDKVHFTYNIDEIESLTKEVASSIGVV